MTVQGLAGTDSQVAKFIANLARNPLIGSVDLSFSQEKLIDKALVREFKLNLKLKDNVDAVNLVREMGIGKKEKVSGNSGKQPEVNS